MWQFVFWGVSMDPIYSNTHIPLPSPRTDMEDSMELARGVTTSMMARDLSRLKILASDDSLIVHACRRVDFYIGPICTEHV